MKKILLVTLVVCMVLAMLLTGCGKTKILHCDHCGQEVKVQESSNMEESWIIYCEECNESLFGDDPLLGSG